MLYDVVISTKFETVIMIAIVFSSIKLIYDTYLYDVPATNMNVRFNDKIIDLGRCIK